MASERPAWHALDRGALEAALGASPRGLSREEAALRLARHGPNALPQTPPPSALSILLHQFKSPLIYLLLAAAVVTLAVGDWVDSGVIAAVLALNATIGFIQERRAAMSVRALLALLSPKARVIRDGREWEIEGREVVPGDVILLETGARIPADLRLVTAVGLSVDESLLTGESLPVHKETEAVPAETPLADRRGMAFTGTVVTGGRARGYVVSTGVETELGRIAGSLVELPRTRTPIEERMDRFSRLVGVAIGIACALAFGIGLAEGRPAQEMFLLAVGLAVAAIPEGLPVVLTITLAIGVSRMARRRAIVRRLPAIETLGSTTVIGSDKTGTLTENRMTVQAVATAEAVWDVDELAPPAADSAVHRLLLAGVLANEAELYRSGEGWESRGDPTEAALLLVAERLGQDHDALREAWEPFADIPFEPERQYSAAVRDRGGVRAVFVKGAPERVLSMCDALDRADGTGALDREAVGRMAADLASRGLRVLAMAWAELGPEACRWTPTAGDPAGLRFLGLVGMMDPPRAGVPEAIASCHSAGIRVVMITGDHVVTARAIAADLGIAGRDAPALTGVDLQALDDEALVERVREVSVYARVPPDGKLRVVEALRRRGEVVAVTGDGVNDAPALRAADVGVAMGKGGTDVAREASDVVLADDNFVSLVAAVEEGRIVFDNVRKVTFFLVSTGAGAILALLASLALDWPVPFLPAQLLWLNLVTNGLQDVALAFEPGSRQALRRPPRRRGEGVLSPLLWERTALAGVVLGAGTLWVFQQELSEGASLEVARTAALTTMVLFQNFHVANARSETGSVFTRSPFSNPFLVAAVAGALFVHVASLWLPATQFVLRVTPLHGLESWLRIVGVASTIVVAMELHKLARRRRPAAGVPARG